MRADLEQRLRYCHNLPTLPGVALRIIGLANNPDSDLAEVAKVIAMDPVLVVKLLKVANSPLYGLRRKSENLRQAITLLGLNATLTLALGFSLSAPLRHVQHNALDTDLYWRRSVLAAVACRALGEQQELDSPEELFLAGLLHDIGMLVLDSLMPDEYGPLIAAVTNHDRLGFGQPDYARLAEIEREVLGADHVEVGAWLLRHWNLPEYLQWALTGSQNPANANIPSALIPLVSCVAVAGYIADCWLHPEDEQVPVRAVEAAKRWLGMDDESYFAVLEVMATNLHEISTLFEIQLVDPLYVKGVLAQAEEVLTIRNLRLMQEVTDAKHRTELLESRARTLEEQNRRDPLTGLYNRGWLHGVLQNEFNRANEHGWPLGVAFIDLDHFKQVNDLYGHQAGDEVLVSVARLLIMHLRQTDMIARYGGEEFLAVLPGIGTDAMYRLFVRVLDTLRNTKHVVKTGETLRVTASIGLAAHLDRGYRFESYEALVLAADQMVYAAKRRGRDEIVIYPGNNDVVPPA